MTYQSVHQPIDETLADRGGRYGQFADNAKIAQDLKTILRHTAGWPRLTPSQREALDQITSKVSRILTGTPSYADNWHDIAGYARLVERELTEASKPPEPVWKPMPGRP